MIYYYSQSISNINIKIMTKLKLGLLNKSQYQGTM